MADETATDRHSGIKAAPDTERQQSDLRQLADGMDGHEQEAALSRILAHHVRTRKELDDVCKRLGDLEESNAALAAEIVKLRPEQGDAVRQTEPTPEVEANKEPKQRRRSFLVYRA